MRPSRHTRADAAHPSGAGSKRTKMVEVLVLALDRYVGTLGDCLSR